MLQTLWRSRLRRPNRQIRQGGPLGKWHLPFSNGPQVELYRVCRQTFEGSRDVGRSPTDADAKCEPNIQIVFSTSPQDLLDNIRKHYDVLLGYHDNSSQAEELAKVTHAIQAWYSTVTIDERGRPNFDGAKIPGMGCLDLPKCRIFLPHASAYPAIG